MFVEVKSVVENNLNEYKQPYERYNRKYQCYAYIKYSMIFTFDGVFKD